MMSWKSFCGSRDIPRAWQVWTRQRRWGCVADILAVLFLTVLPHWLFAHLTRAGLIAGADTAAYYFPIRRFVWHTLQTAGYVPWWNSLSAGGSAIAGDPQAGLLYPLDWLGILFSDSVQGFNCIVLLHYTLAGCGAYVLARTYVRSRSAALLAGVAFMCSGSLCAHRGHTSLVYATAWLPWILAMVERVLRRPSLATVGLLTLCCTLQLYAGYFQVTLYTGLATAIAVLFRVILRRGKVLPAILVTTGWVLALGCAAAFLMMVFYLGLDSLRGQQLSYEYCTSYSFPFKLLPLIVIPFLQGSATPGAGSPYTSPYWGPWNLTEMACFSGFIVLSLAVYCTIYWLPRRTVLGRATRLWFIIALVSAILAFGSNTPAYRIVYALPVYNLFRVPARHWLLWNLACTQLAVFGFTALVRRRGWRRSALVRGVLGTVLCFCAVFLVACVFSHEWCAKLTTWFLAFFALGGKSDIATILGRPAVFALLAGTVMAGAWHRTRFVAAVIVLVGTLLELREFARYHDHYPCPVTREHKHVTSPPLLRTLVSDAEQLHQYNRVAPVGDVYTLGAMGLNPNTHLNLGIASLISLNPLVDKAYHRLTGMAPEGTLANPEDYIVSRLPSVYAARWLAVDRTRAEAVALANEWFSYAYTADTQAQQANLFLTHQWVTSDNVVRMRDGIHMYARTNHAAYISSNLSLRSNTWYVVQLTVVPRAIPSSLALFWQWAAPGINLARHARVIEEPHCATPRTYEWIVPTHGLPEMATMNIAQIAPATLILQDLKVVPLIRTTTNATPFYVPRYADSVTALLTVTCQRPYLDVADTVLLVPDQSQALLSLHGSTYDQPGQYHPIIVHTGVTATTLVQLTDVGDHAIPAKPSNTNTLTLLSVRHGYLKAAVERISPALVIVRENFARGWRGRLNGVRCALVRVDGNLMGIFVPCGSHVLEFSYQPPGLRAGALVSVTTAGIIIGLCTWPLIRARGRHRCTSAVCDRRCA